MAPKGVSGRYAEKSMLPGPVLCLYWACLGMVWGRSGGWFGAENERVDMEKVHEAPWYEMYPMFILIFIAAFFGIFPHYLMDPINTACYDILNFMGVL